MSPGAARRAFPGRARVARLVEQPASVPALRAASPRWPAARVTARRYLPKLRLWAATTSQSEPSLIHGRARQRASAAADRAALARHLARAGLCAAPCCGADAPTGDNPCWPCCCEACLQAWNLDLQRRDECRAARRLGIPVAEYRLQQKTAH